MALLPVLEFPDKRLRNKAQPVTEMDAKVRQHVDNMFETMYQEDGVGLAAIQVNIQQRIVVIDISEDKKSPLCLINPEIIYREGVQYEYEGCISFPNVYEKIERAAKVRMRALDIDGKSYEMEADGLLAICFQHEIDHLDGILYIDHLSKLRQDRLRKKLEKSRKHA